MNEFLRQHGEKDPVAAAALQEVFDNPKAFTAVDHDALIDWPPRNHNPAGIIGVYLVHDPKKVRDPAFAFNRAYVPLMQEYVKGEKAECFAITYASHVKRPQAIVKGRGTWQHNQESKAIYRAALELEQSKERLLGGYILWRAQGRRDVFTPTVFAACNFVDNLHETLSENVANGGLPEDHAYKAACLIIADMLPVGHKFRDRTIKPAKPKPKNKPQKGDTPSTRERLVAFRQKHSH